tara:strand:+ start:41 stop:340 length:300 start_codon:yes stop_codon:yes gene_type:complete
VVEEHYQMVVVVVEDLLDIQDLIQQHNQRNQENLELMVLETLVEQCQDLNHLSILVQAVVVPEVLVERLDLVARVAAVDQGNHTLTLAPGHHQQSALLA